MGYNTTAANFSTNITGFDSADEFISVWKNNTWDDNNWLWTMYYGDDSGTDFILNQYDVIRITLNDGDGYILIPMNYTGTCNCSKTIKLQAGHVNRGYNYTCLCVATNASTSNLSNLAGFLNLPEGDILSRWNNGSHKWNGHITGFTWIDYPNWKYCVIESKISTDVVWVME